MKKLSEADIPQLVSGWLRETLAMAEAVRVTDGPYTPKILKEERREIRALKKSAKENLAKRNYAPFEGPGAGARALGPFPYRSSSLSSFSASKPSTTSPSMMVTGVA